MMDKTRNLCNEMLFGLLGSEELVEKWWMSYNKEFNKTPNEQWEIDPDSVFDYIGFFCYGR